MSQMNLKKESKRKKKKKNVRQNIRHGLHQTVSFTTTFVPSYVQRDVVRVGHAPDRPFDIRDSRITCYHLVRLLGVFHRVSDVACAL